MKVLLLNGSPNAGGCTHTALEEVAAELKRCGVDGELMHIGAETIRGCAACFKCLSAKTGRCAFGDDIVNTVIDRLALSDALVVGSPVYYAGMSGTLTALMDRVFFANFAVNGYANKLAASVVSCRRGGASAAFDQINHYYLMSNMHVIGSQYWNQVHGWNGDDVRKDLEGLQTMRTLAKNMAFLLKCMEAGRHAGVSLPAYEPVTMTDFIR